ncbi:MAG TPA: alpha/beta hydrolase [Microthrixaceae bacterium]|nr:alpha/beta hydrolase [Microthrixaceae bacterium]
MEPVLRSAVGGALAILNARKPRIRSRVLTIPSFFSGWITTEAAGLLLLRRAVHAVRAWRLGRYRTTQGKVALALDAVTMAGLVGLIQQGRRTDEEFEAVLAPYLDAETLAARPSSVRNGAIIPLFTGASTTKRMRNVGYVEDARWRNKLDVYQPKRVEAAAHEQVPEGEAPKGSVPRPAIVEIHGGGWILGDKNQQGVPLLHHMVKNGWVGFNINYRLAPKAKFPEQLIDCKRAIAWIRRNAVDLGVDPDFICVTGGSAGGYLTSMMALTANDPEFQPGFEDDDTTVQAAVPFYGVYDLEDSNHAMANGFDDFLRYVVVGTKMADDLDRYRRFSPLHRVHADAPPMMIVHGTPDTLVPVEQARPFAEAMAKTSEHAVVYAELAGANHAFDIFPSPRSVRTTEYVERFLSGVHLGLIK